MVLSHAEIDVLRPVVGNMVGPAFLGRVSLLLLDLFLLDELDLGEYAVSVWLDLEQPYSNGRDTFVLFD